MIPQTIKNQSSEIKIIALIDFCKTTCYERGNGNTH